MPRTRQEPLDTRQARARLEAIARREGETAPLPFVLCSLASLPDLGRQPPPPIVTAPNCPDSITGLVRVLQAAREEARERRLAEASA